MFHNNKETKGDTFRLSFLLILISLFFYSGNKFMQTEKVVTFEAIPVVKASEPSPSPISEPSTPEEYIRYKFGEKADNAFLILQGVGCSENKSLNPRAVNDNRTWGGLGRDRGIFQINDYFHPLTDEQAFDWKQNIDYAYRMWKNDGETFKRWTCGRFHGV